MTMKKTLKLLKMLLYPRSKQESGMKILMLKVFKTFFTRKTSRAFVNLDT